MNQFELQIFGKAQLESPLDDKFDISAAFKRLGIRSITKTPLEDGFYKYTYKAENLDIVTVITEAKVIQGKNKSNSKRLRNRAWLYSQDNGLDDEKFYDDIINKIIINFDYVVEVLNQKD